MIDLSNLEVWFVTGSQHLYGPETLKEVEVHATAVARGLGNFAGHAGKDYFEAGDDQPRFDSSVVPGSE